MNIGQGLRANVHVEVAAGSAFALLVALAAASAAPRAGLPREFASVLDDVGDTEGEAWLNLLGVPLDAGPPYTAERLLDELRSFEPVELRRHLLGRFAWSWCSLAGTDVIEAAAGGDPAAAEKLLEHPRYYGGHARSSLTVLLGVDPEETRSRLVRAAALGLGYFIDSSTRDRVDAAERTARVVLEAYAPLVAIERLATGFRYVPEPEAESVTLVPHLEPRLPLVLAQHRSSRLVVYRSTPDRGSEERLQALGRALADPKRVEILGLVGRGIGRPPDLVSEARLSRSTVHHHLGLLRDAGLIALEGNARAYTYVPRPRAAAEAAELVADVLGTKEET
jgi:DNA-binding transcriptional ArsR family regulator